MNFSVCLVGGRNGRKERIRGINGCFWVKVFIWLERFLEGRD